ncbi:hypothetical protein NFI96_017866 [Prochilodus magdalenae]|nr:hypothetical protein NFI96_017866 [Prochilodus magdalenae]
MSPHIAYSRKQKQMMLKAQRSQTLVSLIVLMVLTLTLCQENERRAVTEHQLMHDRGRSIQSLKRLIWLSSAIEGLHTAHTRTPTSMSDQKPADSSIHRGALELLLSDMYRPSLITGMGDGEK